MQQAALNTALKRARLKEGGGGALTTGGGRAGLTGSIPGLADVVGTAAHPLGHVKGQLIPTRAVVMPEADALPHVCSWVGEKDVGKRHQRKTVREAEAHSQIHLKTTGLTSLRQHTGECHSHVDLSWAVHTWTTIHGSPETAALFTAA